MRIKERGEPLYLLVDEPGNDFQLRQLLLPCLSPNIMSWYVTGPVDPIPGSSSSNVFHEVLNCPQREVTFAVGSPVTSLPPPPAGKSGVLTAAQRLFTFCSSAGHVVLKVNMVIIF